MAKGGWELGSPVVLFASGEQVNTLENTSNVQLTGRLKPVPTDYKARGMPHPMQVMSPNKSSTTEDLSVVELGMLADIGWYISSSEFFSGNFNGGQLSTKAGWSSQPFGDFNNDGQDDIANFHPSNGTWWVSLSDNGQFTTVKWTELTAASGWTSFVAGDFDGDGLDDLASYRPSSGRWVVVLSLPF